MSTRISTIVFIAFIAACTGPAALTSTGERIPPHTNTIYIVTEDDEDVAFKKMAQLFVGSGYSLKSSDSELGAISTDRRKIGQGKLELYPQDVWFTALVMEGEQTKIQLRGAFQGQNLQDDIRLFGATGSYQRVAWNEMLELAQKYEGASLEFAINK